MKALRFKCDGRTMRHTDAAIVEEGEDLGEAIATTVLDSIGTDLNITIGGTTMFLSAWRDPDHWSDDWAEKLGIDPDDVQERVEELLQSAVENRA